MPYFRSQTEIHNYMYGHFITVTKIHWYAPQYCYVICSLVLDIIALISLHRLSSSVLCVKHYFSDKRFVEHTRHAVEVLRRMWPHVDGGKNHTGVHMSPPRGSALSRKFTSGAISGEWRWIENVAFWKILVKIYVRWCTVTLTCVVLKRKWACMRLWSITKRIILEICIEIKKGCRTLWQINWNCFKPTRDKKLLFYMGDLMTEMTYNVSNGTLSLYSHFW